MSRFTILSSLVAILLSLMACEQRDDFAQNNVWQGSGEAFEREFQYQPDLGDSLILIRNGSNESYSGSVERNDSGTMTKQIYFNGLLNGKSIKKSADGSWVEASYVDGKLEGPMKLYDRSGEIRSILNYSKGKLRSANAQ
jgi:hypothetical protein